jgi:uncharacterized membrane protein
LESQGRQAYLDRVRGIAVLVMIEAHVLDSWTLTSERSRHYFIQAMVLAGFAAPLFLFLAGVSSVLSAESKYRKTGDARLAWRHVQKRGWQVFGLAFLFRLQSFILTGGYSPIGLLKVDILNIMGPAIALVGWAGGRAKTRPARAAVFTTLAVAVSLLSPIVRMTPLLDWLPDPVEWYFRPSPTRTNFTLFPWAGFVFAGAVAGMAIELMRRVGHPMRVQLGLAAASILLAWAGYRAAFLPTIYEHSEFWTTSPTFFLIRVGLITLLLPLAYLWELAPWRGLVSRWSPVAELGKSSLFVYWIHVEMVYGFISRPLRRSLSFEWALVAYVMFTAFILALVVLKNRGFRLQHPGPLTATGPTPASV